MQAHGALDARHRPETCHANDLKRPRGARPTERFQTALRSYRVLRDLTPEQIQNFMDSYLIYSLDWADEGKMVATLGKDYENVVGQKLADYYCVLNHLCALGELEKMYIPPAMDLDQNLTVNQILYERQICEELQLPANNARVLELGCGRGRVAAHISSLTSARITGLNIDADQIASAQAFNTQQCLHNTFVRADFNSLPLPFESASFDAFYQIQAFSLAKDHDALCRELFRLLKPGARLSLLDWVSLEAYNPDNAHHTQLMTRIKPLIGAVGTPTPASLAASLEKAGFVMLDSSNVSINGLQAPLIERADGFFRNLKRFVLGGVKFGLLPGHFRQLFERLTKDCDAFVEADRQGLCTTSWRWLAVKPDTMGKEMDGEEGKEGWGWGCWWFLGLGLVLVMVSG
ncbi:hypothetical protein CERZMDRAFT_41750 [Cercospora zeae-maydis SCOH1-5]|uniref:Methyltransferase type 11 domain-containing protein n=1 Tax=Cercospora zeae-maydis SCOH1-5 TaxID=717836 RepID=A0A6A6FFM4_9PEZI|nr:hypothetical protein CERZMDRAFT_41750 [Cercospora zeae-maydis SCOH1-5]